MLPNIMLRMYCIGLEPRAAFFEATLSRYMNRYDTFYGGVMGGENRRTKAQGHQRGATRSQLRPTWCRCLCCCSCHRRRTPLASRLFTARRRIGSRAAAARPACRRDAAAPRSGGEGGACEGRGGEGGRRVDGNRRGGRRRRGARWWAARGDRYPRDGRGEPPHHDARLSLRDRVATFMT